MKNSDIVSRSFGRCLKEGTLLFDKFYDHFLKSDARIAPMFRNTDMSKQKALLRAGINYAIMFSTDTGRVAGQLVLSRIRKSHSKSLINVLPELYPFWTQSLIKALKETDPKFSKEVEDAWLEILNTAVVYIKSGYTEPSSVSIPE